MRQREREIYTHLQAHLLPTDIIVIYQIGAPVWRSTLLCHVKHTFIVMSKVTSFMQNGQVKAGGMIFKVS